MDALTQLLRMLTRYHNENELFYAFTGELALHMLGSGEQVRTVELTANLTSEERARLLNFLEQEGLTTEHRWRGPVMMRHRTTGMGLRLRLADSRAELAAIGRRVPVTLGFEHFFIPATEDLLLDLINDKDVAQERIVPVYLKWRNYLDMSYMVAAARSRGIYDRFIRMKMKAEK
jgi:hypothetical protein